MYEYKDISGLTRTAIISLWIYMVLNALYGVAALYVTVLSPQPEEGALFVAAGAVALLSVTALFACFVIVGRWIYRASKNAHTFDADLTISPGWAVGWYFVPLANLFKPFEAMKETWLASHFGGNWHRETAPSVLNWWWGLWILTNILGNISFKIADNAPEAAAWIDFTGGLLNVSLSLVLISIMKQVVDAQDLSFRHAVFA